MTTEHVDFGVVPVRRWNGDWEFFLVQHHLGHWSFPKGHQEPGENGEQTARRELAEETGITDVELHSDRTFMEEYRWSRDEVEHHKTVTYFLGLVGDHTIAIQAEELRDGRWVPSDEVGSVLTFPEGRAVFQQARDFLKKQKPWG